MVEVEIQNQNMVNVIHQRKSKNETLALVEKLIEAQRVELMAEIKKRDEKITEMQEQLDKVI